MTDYNEILNRTYDDIPKDQLLPEGSWLLRGKNVTLQQPKQEGHSPRLVFIYQVKEPMADVDQAALDALNGFDIQSKQVFYTLFLQRAKDWDVVISHLAKHGIPVPAKGSKVTLQDSIDKFPGSEVIAVLGTKTFQAKSGETVIDNDPTIFEAV